VEGEGRGWQGAGLRGSVFGQGGGVGGLGIVGGGELGVPGEARGTLRGGSAWSGRTMFPGRLKDTKAASSSLGPGRQNRLDVNSVEFRELAPYHTPPALLGRWWDFGRRSRTPKVTHRDRVHV
jgi:hypothetical protein